MKKILLSTLVLGSTVALAACGSSYNSDSDLDGTLTGAPYAEERTVGATGGTVVRTKAPVVRSAEPVFESSQVK